MNKKARKIATWIMLILMCASAVASVIIYFVK